MLRIVTHVLFPVSAAHTSILLMDSTSTTMRDTPGRTSQAGTFQFLGPSGPLGLCPFQVLESRDGNVVSEVWSGALSRVLCSHLGTIALGSEPCRSAIDLPRCVIRGKHTTPE